MVKNNKQIFAMLIIYLIMFVLGLVSMLSPNLGFNSPVLYASVLFYIIAFFGILGYFWSRDEKKDYEMLFFSLINIISASFLFISIFAKTTLTLGTGFLIFVILESLNKIYYAKKLKNSGSKLWMLRAISIILILFLSILTVQNFYRALSEVQSIMTGYYFVSFGLISACELILVTQINEKTFERIINGEFDEIKKDKKSKLNSKKN